MTEEPEKQAESDVVRRQVKGAIEFVKILRDIERDLDDLNDEDAETFICPICGAVSYNPNDIKFKYCGRSRKLIEKRIDELEEQLTEFWIELKKLKADRGY